MKASCLNSRLFVKIVKTLFSWDTKVFRNMLVCIWKWYETCPKIGFSNILNPWSKHSAKSEWTWHCLNSKNSNLKIVNFWWDTNLAFFGQNSKYVWFLNEKWFLQTVFCISSYSYVVLRSKLCQNYIAGTIFSLKNLDPNFGYLF